MTPLEWWGYADRGARMTDTDRMLVLALRGYETGLCPGGCGQHKSECMDEANDGSPGSAGKYVVPPPWMCFACDALSKAQTSFREGLDKAGAHDHGQYQWDVALVPLRPRPATPHTT